MSTSMPESQTVQRKVKHSVDDKLAAVATQLTPQLHEWTERPLEAIEFVPEPSTWFQHKSVKRFTIQALEHESFGRGDEFILDFGSHRVGYFGFRLGAVGNNIDAPCRLKITFGEVPFDVVEHDKPCDTWISTSWLPDEVINVDWLPTDVRMPRRYAFRFVRIQIIDTSQKYKCIFSDVHVRAVSAVSPHEFAQVPELRSQDPLLRQIDLVSRVTLRDCMQSVFEDGPRRDRRLWLGDLRLQALTNYATFQHHELVKRCLYMFAATAAEDGSIPACVFEFPMLKAASDYIVDYDALFGVVVYDYAVASGDLASARELWPVVLESIKTALSHVDEQSGAFTSAKTSLWKFLDWDERLHVDAGMHGLLLYCCRRIDALADLLGLARPHEAIIPRLVQAARDTFLRDHNGSLMFSSGPEAQVSWLSQAWMALGEALMPEETKQILLTVLKDNNALRPLCPYGWATFAEALAVNGAEQECLTLIKQYWGGMVERGADTFWECYDPDDATRSPYGDCRNNSYCHAWSCTPAWLLRAVLRV